MREAIREHLELLQDYSGAFDPDAVTPETAKPYFVIAQRPEEEDSPWAGFRRNFEVWVNLDHTNFDALDDAEAQVKSHLGGELLETAAGAKFTPVYLGGIGDDSVLEDFRVITRGLLFAVLAVQPIPQEEAAPQDSWVSALAEFTDALLNPISDPPPDPLPDPLWSIYTGRWPQGYKRPALLWRLEGAPAIEDTTAQTYEITKTLVCHVLGATPNGQDGATLLIADKLASAIKVPLDLGERRYLTVQSVSTRTVTDPFKEGQLTITLSRRQARGHQATELMGVAKVEGDVT